MRQRHVLPQKRHPPPPPPKKKPQQTNKQLEQHLQYSKVFCSSFNHWACTVCLLVGCLTSQQYARVFQGRICSDSSTCCQTFHLTQSQYTDTGPTSPSADPITPGAWQGSHWSANFQVTGMTRPRKISEHAGFEPGLFRSRGGRYSH